MSGLFYVVPIVLSVLLFVIVICQALYAKKLHTARAELAGQLKQCRQILTSNAKVLKGKMFLRLCYGADIHTPELMDIMSFFHFSRLQNVSAVLIQFPDSAPLFNNFHKDAYYLEQQNLIEACNNAAKDFFSSFWQWENPRTIIGIIELSEGLSENMILLGINELGAVLQKVCTLDGNKSPAIAFGGISQSLETLSISYNEALELLNHKIHNHLITPYSYEEFKRTEIQFDYNKQLLLARYVRLGKAADAAKLLNSYFSVIHANPDTSVAVVRDTSKQIIKVIQTAVEEMSVIYAGCLPLFSEAGQVLDGFTTVHDFGRYLLEITQKICEIVLSANASRGKIKIQDLISWLNENYSQDISLETMSSYIGCSPAYTSRLFKKETGCDIMTYLATIRINHAKELLGTTTMTLTEISASVGFNHQQTFIRNFKNLVGLTPTEYRNSTDSKNTGE